MSRLSALTKPCLLGAALALLLYCLVIVLSPLAGPQPFVNSNNGMISVSDFVIIYDAGKIASSPDRNHIYDEAVQLKWLNEATAPNKLTQPFYLQYPPWFFTLMTPLAQLSINQAYVAWTFFWLTASAACLYLILVKSAITSKLDRLLVISFSMASAPAISSLKLGQTSLWLLVCISIFCLGFLSKKDRPAAWALVLASVKLQYCIFFLIPVLALKRFRLMSWAMLLGAILLAVTVFDVSIDSFLQYPAFLSRIESSGTGGVAAAAMVNIQGLCLRFLPSSVSFWTSACVFVIALVYLSSLWWRGRQLDDSGQRFLLATTIAIALLTSMHTHFHDCILLAAAVLCLKSVQIVCRDPSKEYGLWFFLLINYPMLSWICYIYQDQGGMTVLALINLALAVCGALYSEKLIKQCPQAISSAPRL